MEDDTQAFLQQFVFAGSENQVHRLQDFVIEYRDIFSDVLAERAADLTPFRFNVEEPLWETPGNWTPCRPQSVKNNIEIEKTITTMLADGVIEKSNTSYYSHPVTVQKTEDKVRVCIYYRNLNDCIKPASWPLPNIRGLFERIGHNKPTVFGVMDLTAGYHQAPLYPPHRVFCGLYQFTRLPFGPKRAPSYFQEQMVTKVLQGLLYVPCEMYLDECIVYASSEDQFLVQLKEVFQRFRERGLLLKAKECKFGLPQIEYVGRVISKEGLSMLKVKIQSVLNFEKPRNLHALRSLLGLANYFQGFVPNHSLIVKPLQDMIDHKGKKNSPLVWTQGSSDAFQAIRKAISHCPLMHFLDDTDAPIWLYTDASDYDIGGVLFQIVLDDIWHPISFVSKSFNATQSRWSTIQKEAYAIFHCLSKLQDEAKEKEKTDDDQSLSEFMSVTGEVVSYREYVTSSPDNLDNIDEEENQGGTRTMPSGAILPSGGEECFSAILLELFTIRWMNGRRRLYWSISSVSSTNERRWRLTSMFTRSTMEFSSFE